MELRIEEEKILNDLIRVLKSGYISLTDYKYHLADITQLSLALGLLIDQDIQGYYYKNNKYMNYMSRASKYNDILSEFTLEYDYHVNLSNNIIKVMDKNFIYYDRRCLNKLTEKEFLEIERDFLGTFDERILKIFDDYSKRGLIDMSGAISGNAFTYPLFLNNNHMIILPDELNIFNLSTLSHELGHLFECCLLDVRSKKQLYGKTLSYEEFISHYLEFNLQHYLKENHIYLKDTLITENNIYSRLKDYFSSLNDILYGEDDLEDIDEIFSYSYGSYLGLLMHDRFIDNPIETRKDVDNYLFNSGLLNKDELLDKLGLSKDTLMDNKVLSKRINRHSAVYKEYNL